MSKIKNSRNNKLYPNATDIKYNAHKSTVTFTDMNASEIQLNSVRRNSLPGHLTSRNQQAKLAHLGRITHNSSVFSSQMDYNRSVMSARLAQKESVKSSQKVKEKLSNIDSTMAKADQDHRWRSILDNVQNKSHFFRRAFDRIGQDALELSKPIAKHM